LRWRLQLQYLVEVVGLDIGRISALRYQLLHRTASALLEAQRYNARHAMMLVHSFSRAKAGFDDYCAFARSLGGSPQVNAITTIGERAANNTLHLAWVTGDERFLTV
jgi:hypothetical protein